MTGPHGIGPVLEQAGRTGSSRPRGEWKVRAPSTESRGEGGKTGGFSAVLQFLPPNWSLQLVGTGSSRQAENIWLIKACVSLEVLNSMSRPVV